jgi:hypothetical protein
MPPSLEPDNPVPPNEPLSPRLARGVTSGTGPKTSESLIENVEPNIPSPALPNEPLSPLLARGVTSGTGPKMPTSVVENVEPKMDSACAGIAANPIATTRMTIIQNR